MRHNVQSNTPWYLEGLDPETRDAAREAARRAGMSLDEWLQATISDRAARAFTDRGYGERGYADRDRGYADRAYPDRGHYERAAPARDDYDAAPTVRRKASTQRPAAAQPRKNSLYDELDAIAGRIARATRGQGAPAPAAEPAPHQPSQKTGIDSIVAAVTAETERRTRESTAKTTEALDSVVRWIERTEERMNESNRSLSDTARMALERQDHTANVLGEALAMMTKRLDEIEGKVSEGHQPAMNAALQAVAKVEAQLEKLGREGREAIEQAPGGHGRPDPAQQAGIENALRSFEERIASITEKLAETNARSDAQAPQGRAKSGLAGELQGALAEIRGRRDDADFRHGARGRAADEHLELLRADVARLGAQLQAVKENGSRDAARHAQTATDLRHAMDDLTQRMTGLAMSEDVAELEESLSELTREAIKAADAGRERDLAKINGLIIRVQDEISRVSDATADKVHARIVEDYKALAEKIDALAHSDRDLAATLTRELETMRTLYGQLAEPGRVEEMNAQLREMSHRLNHMARSQVDAVEFATLRSAVDDIRGAVKSGRSSQADAEQMREHFGALSRKMDEISVGGHGDEALAQMSARIDAMAGKLEEVADRLTNAQATAMADEIAEISTDLGRLPASSAPALSALNQHFAQFSKKLDELGERIATIDVAPRATLEREFRQLQANLEAGLAARTSHSEGIDALMARMDRLDENMRGVDVKAQLQPLEEMLSQLAGKLDAASQPNAGLDAIDALEAQIGEIARRLESERGESSEPSPLDRAMGDLMRQIESMREGAVEAAERAAKTAIADTLEALPRGDSKGEVPAELDFLTRSLSDLKALQSAAEQRSMDTLGSVQGTLDKLVERLTLLESKARGPRQASRPAPQAQPQKRAADGQKPAVAGTAAGLDMSPAQLLDLVKAQQTGKQQGDKPPSEKNRAEGDEARRYASGKPQSARTGTTGYELPALTSFGTLGADTLLEPGAGRPQPATETTSRAASAGKPTPDATATNEAENDTAEIKASFIAAARRAAQNAAAEAAASSREGDLRAARARARGASPEPKKSTPGPNREADAGSARAATLGRRRPMLMAAAAVVLTVGAYQIGSHLITDNDAPVLISEIGDNPDTARAAANDAAQDTALPATGESLAADLPAEDAAAGPMQTASIPDGEPGSFDVSQIPRIVGMDDLLGEDAAARGDVMLPPRRESGEETASRRVERVIHPNIVSADEIPADITVAGLRDAVLEGDVAAVYTLADRAASGEGMSRDPALAAKLFERAAAHGFIPAQFRIGSHYEKGIGVSRDFTLASLWYERAADSGNARAMHNLAVLLAEGVRGEADFAGAREWFAKAAEYGIRDSQYNLAVLLARGLGGEQDLAQSFKWFAIAAKQGDTDAASKRDEVAGRLDEGVRAAAEAEVELWRARNPDPQANEVIVPEQARSATLTQADKGMPRPSAS
jgi:localization factor PodJL